MSLVEDVYTVIETYFSPLERVMFSAISKKHTRNTDVSKRKVRTVDLAARRGYKGIVKWCFKGKHHMGDSTSLAAAKSGNLKLVKWLERKRCPRSLDAILCAAAKRGHLKILKWYFTSLYYRWPVQVLYEATKRGQFKVVKWCFWTCETRSRDENFKEVMRLAAEHRSPALFEWCIKNNCPLTEDAFLAVLKSGNANLFSLCKKKWGCLPARATTMAVEGNNLDVVKQCVEAGSKIYGDELLYAAWNANLPILKLLVENGAVVDDFIVDQVSQSGNAELLDYCLKVSSQVIQ